MPDVPLASLAPQSPLAAQVAGFPQVAGGAISNLLGLTDAGRALRGEMTDDEARNFALTGALGMLPMAGDVLGPAARVAEKIGPEAAVPLLQGIKAFHGSPYDFDKFDLSKIGIGEGAQAYGHGLYFAENPDVANAYRPFGSLDLPPPGKTYEVNINADPEHFLDWDKPLSEQSEHVQQAAHGLFPDRDLNIFGQTLGKYLESFAGKTPEEAAAALRQAGIPGIKYLDKGSRGAGNGTYNYVMFDDSLIDILKKYGLASLVGGSGVGAAMQNQVPLSSLQQ